MKFVVFIVLTLLVGCSTPNNVEKHVPESAVVKYKSHPEYQDRFRNLYTGKQTYPVTCEKDCYPTHQDLQCNTVEGQKETCLYLGSNHKFKTDAGFSIKWFGHASFSVSTKAGDEFLIDPVSGQFDWPVDWAFRLTDGFFRNEPESTYSQNNAAVLYSHIHYDHFNKQDISDIGNSPEYLVPLGFAEHFEQQGYQIKEMAWFSDHQSGNSLLSFVPAHHFSSRIWVPYMYEDNDKTLWGGWVINHKGKKLFYAGDTGYSPHFKDIHKQYGDMDVCLIPIASYYHPEDGDWYRHVHTTPEDALQAAEDLNCKVMVPWGYGNNSWQMGDHSSHSALLRLLKMHQQLNSNIQLHILNEGDEVQL